jgi:outer membrane receptor protein involved in Fe transport
MRLSVATAVYCLCTLSFAADPAHASIKKNTRIPSEGLGAALETLARDYDFQVLYRTEVIKDLKTNGAIGSLTSDEALTKVLSGTGLTYKYLDGQTVTVIPVAEVATGAATNQNQANPQDNSQGGGKNSSQDFRLAQVDQGAGPQSAAAPVGGAAPPQDDSRKAALQEVVVSAQKRSENLLDVPVPVTALSAQSLTQSNLLRIQDYASSVPGFVSSPSPSAGGEQMLAIRGISTGFGTNPSVGITIDDVPFGGSTNLVGNSIPDIDPSDLSRVEVLRGPQGTLYGASSLGGLLKFVTTDPSTDSVSGQVQAGTNTVFNGAELGYNFRGSVNVPLGDTLAIRASGFTRQDPGYIDNPNSGVEGLNEDHVDGGRVGLLWKPSDAFSLKLSALVQETKGDGSNDVDVPTAGFPQTSELKDLQQNYVPGVGAYERRTQAYSAILTGKVGGFEISSISGYNYTDFTDSYDYSYALGALIQSIFGEGGVPVYTDNKIRKFSQELRATTRLGDNVDWLFGAFYTHENSPQVQNVEAVNVLTGGPGPSILGIYAPTTYSEYAAFTDVTIHFTDSFDVQLGGRDSEIRHAASETQSGPLGSAPTPETVEKANAFTYLVTPELKISPDLMVYARLASGYRAGGPNGNPDPSVPRSYSPDKTENYELGIKGDFLSHTLTVDGSLYHIDWKDLQLNLLDESNHQTYTTNASAAKSQGVELSVTSRPVTDLKIAGWVTWDDAVLTQAMPANSTVTGNSGDRLPYSSKFSANLSLDQDFTLATSTTGFVGATVGYVGDRLGTFVGAPTARAAFPSYAKIDLRAGVRYDSWSVNLYATNLADKRGILGGGAGTYPPFAFTYIQPRTVGLAVTKDF